MDKKDLLLKSTLKGILAFAQTMIIGMELKELKDLKDSKEKKEKGVTDGKPIHRITEKTSK
jgi:hypothetical protein